MTAKNVESIDIHEQVCLNGFIRMLKIWIYSQMFLVVNLSQSSSDPFWMTAKRSELLKSPCQVSNKNLKL